MALMNLQSLVIVEITLSFDLFKNIQSDYAIFTIFSLGKLVVLVIWSLTFKIPS